MADNVVEVVIKGKDDTGAAYASAEAKEKAFQATVDQGNRKFQQLSDQNARVADRAARVQEDVAARIARAEHFMNVEAEKATKIQEDLDTALSNISPFQRMQKAWQDSSGILGKLLMPLRALWEGLRGLGQAAMTVVRGFAQGGLQGAAASLGEAMATGGQSAAVMAAAIVAIGTAAAATSIILGPFFASLVLITGGLAAFGAAAFPIISNLKTSLSSLSTATDAYQQASLNLSQAIHKSPADMQAYRQALAGLEPDLRSAAQLLTNQKVTWQSLTPAQRASVNALAQNNAALKNLLPDQKNALTALMQQKAAWDALSPAQQKIATSIQGLGGEFSKLQKAVAPQVYQALNTALKILKDLFPALIPLAKAAGNAIDGLLKNIDGWLKSGSGQKFIKWMAVDGPKALKEFGVVVFNTIRGIGATFHFLYDLGETFLTEFRQLAAFLSNAWTSVGHVFTAVWDTIKGAFSAGYNFIAGIVGKITSVLSTLNGALGGIPGKILGGLGIGLASGGIVGAAAGGLRSGLTLVGERGPELVRLSAGSRVYNNAQTMGMIGGGGDHRVVIEVRPSGSGEFDRMMTNWFLSAVRVRGGGDVQVAFGTNH